MNKEKERIKAEEEKTQLKIYLKIRKLVKTCSLVTNVFLYASLIFSVLAIILYFFSLNWLGCVLISFYYIWLGFAMLNVTNQYRIKGIILSPYYEKEYINDLIRGEDD